MLMQVESRRVIRCTKALSRSMHSLVARLRGRATSQATTTSAHSDDTELTTPDTPTAYHGPSAARMALPRSPVDQKILPQVDELMDSFSQIDLGDTGLSPPPIRKRNSEGLPPRRVLASGSDPGPSGAAAEGDPRPDSPASECSSLPERSVRLSRFSRRVASSGLWSTFGRHDAGTSPRSSRMDQQSAWTRFTFGSVDTLAIPRMSDISRLEGTGTVASSVSVDRYGRPSIASETSSGLPGQSYASWRRSDLLAITPDEPTNERSISPDTTSSRHNSTKRSVITQSSRSTSSPAATVHTPSMQTFEFNSSSPNTFGQVSPPQLSAFVSSVSPPPLPPLSHPELVASMATRSQPVLRDLSNTVTPPLRHWSSAIYPKTYPPRRRHRIDSNDENAAPYSATARRTIRAYASLPRVRQMFRADERVSRRGSQKSLRRDSAEWNAAQATSGVLVGDAGEHFGWPAAVSHEMVRLSLGGTALGNGRGTQAALATAADPDIIPSPRVHNVPAGSGEPAARPCSPLLSPVAAPAPRQGQSASPSSSSRALTSSVAGQSDGGESLAQLPSNADNSLSRTPGGVAEAERGMDVGESSTLREDGDRTRQNATLPRAAGPRTPRKSILRQSSSAFLDQEQGSSFPQQQNVKSTPPSRRSSMRHPARHSSEPTLHSVLETPVGKGKRKAEEIDITPPDIRKQHATFVIPTQQRRTYDLVLAFLPLIALDNLQAYIASRNHPTPHRHTNSANVSGCRPPPRLLPVQDIPAQAPRSPRPMRDRRQIATACPRPPPCAQSHGPQTDRARSAALPARCNNPLPLQCLHPCPSPDETDEVYPKDQYLSAPSSHRTRRR